MHVLQCLQALGSLVSAIPMVSDQLESLLGNLELAMTILLQVKVSLQTLEDLSIGVISIPVQYFTYFNPLKPYLILIDV